MDFLKHAFAFGSSLFDVGSDFVNALTFLGYYQSPSIKHHFDNYDDFDKERKHNVSTYHLVDRDIDTVHKTWGVLSMSLIFIPGFCAGVPILITEIWSRKWKDAARSTALILFFPIFLFGLQFKAMISTIRKIKVTSFDQSMVQALIGIETAIESSAQLTLQLFTIIYSYPITRIQAITIVTSFFQLGYSAISKDINTKLYLMGVEQLGIWDLLLAIHYRLPGYTSAIIFRIGSLVVTMAYLSWLSIAPITLLVLELAFIAWLRCRMLKDRKEALVNTAHLILGNIGVLNSFAFCGIENHEREEDDNVKKFVVRSSVITFLHHTTVIITIILIGCYEPNAFEQSLIVKPENERFFWLLGVLILIGIYNLTVILYRGREITAFQVIKTKQQLDKTTQTEKINEVTYDCFRAIMVDQVTQS